MTQKIIKIFILLVLFIFSINYVYAANIDLNMPGISDNTDQNAQNSDAFNNLEQNLIDDEDDNIPVQDSATILPSSATSAPQDGLSITNIINILLITIGVVIIFLSIAILIRLKSSNL